MKKPELVVLEGINETIGMPLTGRNGMCETAFLKYLGDIRWKDIERYTKVKSIDLLDENNNRLYATFFYLDIDFRNSTMANFQESDDIKINRSLYRYQNSMLEGDFLISKINEETPPVKISMSNAFVKKVKDASWLKKSAPKEKGFFDIELAGSNPPSYVKILEANNEKCFKSISEDYVALNLASENYAYTPDPDRDLNGVRLLYFANFPMILDISERALLSKCIDCNISHEALDYRSLNRRQLSILANIQTNDAIEMKMLAFIRNPFHEGNDLNLESEIEICTQFEGYRKSDGKNMFICDSYKKLSNITYSNPMMKSVLKFLKFA